MISPFAQQEVQGSGSQKDFPFFRSPFPPLKGRCDPRPQFFLAAFENAIWRVNYLSTPLKKSLKGPNIFSFIEEEMKNSFFKNPLSSWGGVGGGGGEEWNIECPKTSLPPTPLVYMWSGNISIISFFPQKIYRDRLSIGISEEIEVATCTVDEAIS